MVDGNIERMERIAVLESKVEALQKQVDSLDGRVWAILITNLALVAGVVALILKP